MSLLMGLMLAFLGLLLGLGGGVAANLVWNSKRLGSAKREAEKIRLEAESEARAARKEASLQAKEEIFQARTAFEKESRERTRELKKNEQRLALREENLDRKVAFLDRKDAELKDREGKLSHREGELEAQAEQVRDLVEKQRIRLQRISGLSQAEAKDLLIASMREEAERDAALMIHKIETEARENAEKEANKIIALAIQRYAADHVSENAVSTVALPSDDMKGRIIGREGRNIRAFQNATGVDVVVDDTPEVVVLSAFDPVRREIARISLERLIADGRIHPPRVEEVVKKVEEEVNKLIRETGEQTAFDIGIHGLKPELLKLLGRLKYRTSYGQNVLMHSQEVAYLMGIMASELGLEVHTAKMVGLLHDIGKAVDHEVEGPHAEIGAGLAKKYGLPAEVVQAIASHHGEVEPKSVYDVLAQAADALSAARPGARTESMEAYIKRLQDLEQLAMTFQGVKKAFAIQAGREVRVMVEPERVDDREIIQLARNISRKIEEDMAYPGQVKVTVVRETRAVEYAK